jgi:hypothetical protein
MPVYPGARRNTAISETLLHLQKFAARKIITYAVEKKQVADDGIVFKKIAIASQVWLTQPKEFSFSRLRPSLSGHLLEFYSKTFDFII